MTTGAAQPAPAVRPAPGTQVTKAAAGPATLTYPALDLLTEKATAARSVATALIELAKAGRLGELERDIGALRRDVGSGRVQLVKRDPAASGLTKAAGSAGLSKAAGYERQAAVMTDPALRQGYLELAAKARQEAGAA